jgi:hypothetical protein
MERLPGLNKVRAFRRVVHAPEGLGVVADVAVSPSAIHSCRHGGANSLNGHQPDSPKCPGHGEQQPELGAPHERPSANVYMGSDTGTRVTMSVSTTASTSTLRIPDVLLVTRR